MSIQVYPVVLFLILESIHLGTCTRDKLEPRSYRQTKAYQYFPEVPEWLSASITSQVQDQLTVTNTSMVLMNGDTCRVNNWVLIQSLHTDGQRQAQTVAQVHEICQFIRLSSGSQRVSQPAILLQCANLSWDDQLYRMPAVTLSDHWELLQITVCHFMPQLPPGNCYL